MTEAGSAGVELRSWGFEAWGLLSTIEVLEGVAMCSKKGLKRLSLR